MSRAVLCLVAVGLAGLSIGSIAAQPPTRDTPEPVGTAIIVGRVVEAMSGEPVRKAQVRAVDPTALPKGRTATTDANGHYEPKALPAGHYTVSATKPAYVTVSYGQTTPLEVGAPIEIGNGQTVDRIDLSLSHPGVVAGRVTDELGEPIGRVKVSVVRRQFLNNGSRRWLEVAFRSTNDIGEFRVFGIPPGQYYLAATLPRHQEDVTSNQPAYAPMYYPGTASVADAQRLSIASGQVLSNMNMVLLPVRGVRVSGTAVDSNGRPVSGRVSLRGPDTSIDAAITSDGAFALTNVTPGEYVLRAGDSRTGDQASMPLTVSGSDLRDVALVGVKQTSLSGRVVVDRAATAAIKPSELHVNVRSARPDDGTEIIVPVKDDFTFQLNGWPGPVLITASSAAQGWILKQVRLNGLDVTESGVELGAGPLTGLEVEVTNVASEVFGTVRDAYGAPTRHAWVVVFAQNREKWHMAAPYTANPNIVAVRPDPKHEYRVRALRPGAYYAVAVGVDAVEPGEWNDPEFLDRVREWAVTFEATPGERKTLNLTLMTLER